ncbi:MAG: T9SS type A sorting domain-containing protein, partial [Bacteroidales bacterium]|nr:T9SS type A sorting domain-containing protein [Bacteroidales bacterium]
MPPGIHPTTLQIYPNPAQNHLFINPTVSENTIIRISSLSGIEVKSVQLEKGASMVDISDLSSGAYLIQLQSKSSLSV